MKNIYKAIDNAYSALDDCISKIVKSRLDKDKESEERALYKLEIEANGVLQDLSYIKRQLQKRDWIKVIDRLPEEGTPNVIVLKERHIAFLGRYDYEGFHINGKIVPNDDILCYMTLEPPKED